MTLLVTVLDYDATETVKSNVEQNVFILSKTHIDTNMYNIEQ